MLPPFALAADTCARMIVLLNICTRCARPLSPSSTASPEAGARENPNGAAKLLLALPQTKPEWPTYLASMLFARSIIGDCMLTRKPARGLSRSAMIVRTAAKSRTRTKLRNIRRGGCSPA